MRLIKTESLVNPHETLPKNFFNSMFVFSCAPLVPWPLYNTFTHFGRMHFRNHSINALADFWNYWNQPATCINAIEKLQTRSLGDFCEFSLFNCLRVNHSFAKPLIIVFCSAWKSVVAKSPTFTQFQFVLASLIRVLKNLNVSWMPAIQADLVLACLECLRDRRLCNQFFSLLCLLNLHVVTNKSGVEMRFQYCKSINQFLRWRFLNSFPAQFCFKTR